jgi:hypothetical protein
MARMEDEVLCAALARVGRPLTPGSVAGVNRMRLASIRLMLKKLCNPAHIYASSLADESAAPHLLRGAPGAGKMRGLV